MKPNNVKRQQLDRRTWAAYDTLSYDMLMYGRGEALSDEIYFGRAFSAPPTLSWAALFRGEGEETIPQAIVPPRGAGAIDADTNGLGNHSMRTNPIIYDPSFEGQGQYYGALGADALVIPDVHIYQTDSSYEADQITKSWNSKSLQHDGGAERYPNRDSNYWVQSDEQKARWVVSDDKSHDLGVGAAGKWSAKYVFPTAGDSNWLIPITAGAKYNDTTGVSASNWKWDRYVWISTKVESSDYTLYVGRLGISQESSPPVLRGWGGQASVWSDDACELEVNTRVWHTGGSYIDYGEKLMPDSELWSWGSADTFSYRIINETTTRYPVTADRWNVINVENAVDTGRSLAWPPYQPEAQIPESRITFNYRIVGGSAGQVVHLDNVFMWPDLVNDVIPILTIGVAEWLIDDGGAYIGARLWFKMGKPMPRVDPGPVSGGGPE